MTIRITAGIAGAVCGLAAAIVLVSIPTADGASTISVAATKTFVVSGRIVRLAADGRRVAAATATSGKRCAAVVALDAVTRRSQNFRLKGCSEGPVIRPGVDEVAIAGTRLLWLEATGGNLLDLTLMGARIGQRRSYELASAENQAGAAEGVGGAWLGHLHGAGSLLVYNSWRVAEHGSSYSVSAVKLVKLRGRKRLTIARGNDVVNAAAVGGGLVAVKPFSDGKPLTIRTAAGRVRIRIDIANAPDIDDTQESAPSPYALDGRTLVVKRQRVLDLYSVATGKLTRTIQLGGVPGGARLTGAFKGRAALVGGGRAFVVELATGEIAVVDVPSRKAIVDAALTSSGLFYAYNVTGKKPGRIVLVASAELPG